MVFVNSMSDLFHKGIPEEFVNRVWDTMERANWHTFQILTKRSSLMRDFLSRRYAGGSVPSHIWFGVSIEDRSKMSRLWHLQASPSGIRFLSVEPLIAPVGSLDLNGISWVIVGGESGPRARPLDLEWVRDVRNQCQQQSVAFFFKQWGGIRPKQGGRTLDGREWSEFPRARTNNLAAAAQ